MLTERGWKLIRTPIGMAIKTKNPASLLRLAGFIIKILDLTLFAALYHFEFRLQAGDNVFFGLNRLGFLGIH